MRVRHGDGRDPAGRVVGGQRLVHERPRHVRDDRLRRGEVDGRQLHGHPAYTVPAGLGGAHGERVRACAQDDRFGLVAVQQQTAGTAHAVAAQQGRGTVGVEEVGLRAAVTVVVDEVHAVGAQAVLPVAQQPHRALDVTRCEVVGGGAVDDEDVIEAAVRLGDRQSHAAVPFVVREPWCDLRGGGTGDTSGSAPPGRCPSGGLHRWCRRSAVAVPVRRATGTPGATLFSQV